MDARKSPANSSVNFFCEAGYQKLQTALRDQPSSQGLENFNLFE